MLLIKKQLKWEPRNKTKKEKMAGISPVMSVLNVSGLSYTVKKAKILDFFFKIQLYISTESII